MGWSEQQLEAIYARKRNLLVAAAAGSGKTSVLVERIIRRITDAEQPIDVDRLLVVTFTNAAATEMRTRIGAAISQELKTGRRSRHLERQLVLLNSASISTIHAFCQNVVRQNFHVLDLDPKFRVAGEAECTLLKNDVLEALFEAKYAAGDEDFLRFVDHYGDERSDESLYALVLGLYDYSRSHPWPDNWLAGLKDAFALPLDAQIDDTPWSELIRDKIIIELEQCSHKLTALCGAVGKPGNPAIYASVFTSDRAVVDEIAAAAAHSWGRLDTAVKEAKFEKLPAAKGVADDIKKRFQNERNKIKHKISEYQILFFDRSAADLLDDMRKVAPLVGTLAALTAGFAREYAKAKRDKGLVDFSDLEHFCLGVLLDASSEPGESKPSPVARALQEKYAEIMIDEYQDTNGVQETILKLLARPDEPNLFMVGDVKQSIYRFRLAEPELFMDKYCRYAVDTCDQNRRIDLAQNFRSRPGILHAVNFLFVQLMSSRVAELDYGEAEKLNPGPDYPACDALSLDGPVELHLINKEAAEQDGVEQAVDDETQQNAENDNSDSVSAAELSGFELEARLITRRIIELMEERPHVYDKTSGGYRRLTWRDIVVLLRSTRGKAGVLLDVMRQAGIPAYAEVDSGYFREIEIQVMLSLLSIIDNPRQDIQLAGILRSPIVGLTAAELAQLRLCRQDGDLWSAVTAFAAQQQTESAGDENALAKKLETFLTQYYRWRSFSRRKGVPELIWQIYRDTGYYDYVGGMPGGTLRQANLRALYDRARQYETTNFRGLFRFLRFLSEMQDKGSDLAVARALGESEDVVRIMSIHKSKGLEFPVVIVADLGKKFNLQDSRELVLCHKTLGVGPYVTNPELRYRYPTLARHAIAYKLIMETKTEELRILYVALTRAREKLVLIGSVDKLEQRAQSWCEAVERKEQKLPDALIAGANSYLDWICPAVARHSAGTLLRQCAGCEEQPEPFAGDSSAWQTVVYQKEEFTADEDEPLKQAPLLNAVRELQPVDAGEGTDWVENQLGWQYSYAAAVAKPAKLSVTEIKRRFEVVDEEKAERPFVRPMIAQRPRFAQNSGKLTAVEFGTMMHTVMQHINLTGDLSEQGISIQVGEMVKKELLLPEQAEAADIAAVSQFFTTELGRRMCASVHVRREWPFSLILPAGQLYSELAASKEEIFVQGVVDVLFDEENGLVLVDYKTDRVRDGVDLAARYKVQLDLYAQAVETILRRPVKEKYVYAFNTRQTIKL